MLEASFKDHSDFFKKQALLYIFVWIKPTVLRMVFGLKRPDMQLKTILKIVEKSLAL